MLNTFVIALWVVGALMAVYLADVAEVRWGFFGRLVSIPGTLFSSLFVMLILSTIFSGSGLTGFLRIALVGAFWQLGLVSLGFYYFSRNKKS